MIISQLTIIQDQHSRTPEYFQILDESVYFFDEPVREIHFAFVLVGDVVAGSLFHLAYVEV